ncbi:protein kinase [Acanthocystis turfacea Chlorella virus NE-JV-2]|nr:protein kinase [Acanthocystis turfacea Chlorella virus NE-JV-2]
MQTSLTSRVQRGVELTRYCVRTYKNVRTIQKEGPRCPAADELVRDTAKIGVIALKMAQFLSARGDVIDENTLEVIERFQNEVPIDTFEPPDFTFYDFDKKYPIATASIASVFRGKRKIDNTDVVVKVIKPGVKQRIYEDLPLFILVLEAAKFFNIAGAENMLELVRECQPMLIGELDLRAEAKNQHFFKKNFKGIEWLTIPTVYEAGESYLISEYVESRRITSAHPNKILARRMFELYLRSVIDIGLVQADPHPGNVGVRSDGSFVLYDFGAVIDVRDVKPNIARCLKCIVLEDSDGVIKALEELGIVKSGGSSARLKKIVPKIKKILESPDANMELGKVEEFSSNTERVFQLTTKYIYLIRSLTISEGIIKYHDPKFSLNNYIKKYDDVIEDLVDIPVFDVVQQIAGDFMGTPASVKNMNDVILEMNEKMTKEIAYAKKMMNYALAMYIVAELIALVK